MVHHSLPGAATALKVGAYIYEYADWGGLIVMATHPGTNDKPAGNARPHGLCMCIVRYGDAC